MNNDKFPSLNSGNNPSEPIKKLPLPPRAGKISGFPTPPKRPSTPSSLPKPYSPPAKFPTAPKTSPVAPERLAAAPTTTEEESIEDQISKIIVSEEELQDVYAYRGAQRVKFLDEEKIYILTTSTDPVVRKELAMNPDTPPNILKILAKDEDSQVREEVVYNPSTPKEVYETLINDPSTWVIEALISNGKTPYSVLEQLKVGDDAYLRGLLSKRGL